MYPIGVAVDASGIVFISDSSNNVLRMISDGFVTTIAGGSTSSYSGEYGTSASFFSPKHLALSSAGVLYVAQGLRPRVAKINLNGVCEAGYYLVNVGTLVCDQVPAGYYKPINYFTDIRYVCPAGTYSSGGAASCSTCSVSMNEGSGSCQSAIRKYMRYALSVVNFIIARIFL